MNETKQRWRPGWIWVVAAAILLLLLFLAFLPALRSDRVEQAVVSPTTEQVARTAAAASSLRPAGDRPKLVPTAGHSAAHRLTTQRILKWGSGEGEVGLVRAPEMSPVGPEAFALAKDGSILVADLANHRIQVYDRDGAFLRSIELPGVSLNDLMTDAQGRLYVYDQDRQALLQFDASGAQLTALNLNPKDIATRGYFHMVGDAVYFGDAAARDILVATIKDGQLASPEPGSERRSEGIHAESGRVYSWSVTKGQKLQLQLQEAGATAPAMMLDVAVPDILSACYVGEDQSLRFYVQVERWVEGRVMLEMLTFSPDGAQLEGVRIPENDYAIWTARLLDVAADGTIVQFLPQKDQAKLNLFAE